MKRTYRPQHWPKHYEPKPHPRVVWTSSPFGQHIARLTTVAAWSMVWAAPVLFGTSFYFAFGGR